MVGVRCKKDLEGVGYILVTLGRQSGRGVKNCVYDYLCSHVGSGLRFWCFRCGAGLVVAMWGKRKHLSECRGSSLNGLVSEAESCPEGCGGKRLRCGSGRCEESAMFWDAVVQERRLALLLRNAARAFFEVSWEKRKWARDHERLACVREEAADKLDADVAEAEAMLEGTQGNSSGWERSSSGGGEFCGGEEMESRRLRAAVREERRLASVLRKAADDLEVLGMEKRRCAFFREVSAGAMEESANRFGAGAGVSPMTSLVGRGGEEVHLG